MQLAHAMGMRFTDIDWSRAGDLMADLVDSGIRHMLAGQAGGPAAA